MADGTSLAVSGRVYRLDRFIVPAAARDAFLEKVTATHRVLRQQPGFVRDHLLEQPNGPDETIIVTLAEWSDAEATAPARAAVAEMHRALRFSPQAFMAELGIRAEIGTYRPVTE